VSIDIAHRADVIDRLRAAGCVFAEDEADLLLAAARTPRELTSMVERRVDGLPLEHILGWVEFCGLRIGVDPGVFVPRQRSALLVSTAVSLVGDRPAVVELCCGSGAVAVAVADRVAPGWLAAVDIDPVAAECAERNLAGIGGQVFQGDLFEPLPAHWRGRIDLVLAVAPYVPSSAIPLMPPEARLHEPAIALDGGADGLDVLRRIVGQLPDWLAPGGHLVVEVGAAQVAPLSEALRRTGLVPAVVREPDGVGTVVTARRA
jgi:release factor glutamine methyltransferase